MIKNMNRLIERAVLGLLIVICSTVDSHSISKGNFHGMEENCILSFVVPRDKMKSSCDVNDKIKRRLNAIEMKVNIYKQQIGDIQSQLQKERRFNADRLEEIERQVRESTVSANMNLLLERRLTLLENDVSQMNVGRGKQRPDYVSEQSPLYSYNAVDSNPIQLPNLVRSMVQAEVKTVFDNFTRKIEKYVREQIVVYNQVFSILNKNGEDTTNSARNGGSRASNALKQNGRNHGVEGGLLRELEKVKADLDQTSKEVAKSVETLMDNGLSAKKMSTTSPSTASNQNENTVTLVYSETTSKDDGLESNDSFSGENPDSNETLSEDTFTRPIDTEITGAPRSRISSTKVNNTLGAAKEREEGWKENMIGDENYKHGISEEKLEHQIKKLLYDPLAKMMSVMGENIGALEGKLSEQENYNSKVTKDVNDRMENLHQSVQSNSLQIGSLSKGFQDAFVQMHKITSMESAINEIITNLTSNSVGMSAVELDQQSKKMKKLERLMNVYQQSLEHYKNETKHEYREVQEKLKLESINARRIGRNVKKDVTAKVGKTIDQVNKTLSKRIGEQYDYLVNTIDEYIKDSIDVKSERDKMEKHVGKELREVRDTFSRVLSRSRDCRKKIDNVNKKYSMLRAKVNSTYERIDNVRKEVRVVVESSWVEYDFNYDASLSDCYGAQFVRYINLPDSSVRLVGVIQCNSSTSRYKILLGDSFLNKFLNIGDLSGLGHDHCEFVGASPNNNITLASSGNKVYAPTLAFARMNWGEKPRKRVINHFNPSPTWYECGVNIP